MSVRSRPSNDSQQLYYRQKILIATFNWIEVDAARDRLLDRSNLLSCSHCLQFTGKKLVDQKNILLLLVNVMDLFFFFLEAHASNYANTDVNKILTMYIVMEDGSFVVYFLF